MYTVRPRIRSQSGPEKDMNVMLCSRQRAKNDLNGARCLVVDDDRIVRRLVAYMLVALGYRVDTAEDGQKALQKIYASHFDIVLSDLEMPLINGFLLASRIKSYAGDTHTVIMTGRCHAEVLGLMSPAIVDAWLFKPFNMDELCRVFEDLGLPQAKKSAAV